MQKLTLFAAVSGSQVDREAGILRGVSVITEGDAKGHGMIVDSITLQQVKACAETYTDGLRVKMDHYTGIDAMVGVLRDFEIDGIQLRADLHLIKSHEDFEKILEMAETIPGSFGLSISFSGESEDVVMPSGDSGEVDPNSGELPAASVVTVRAARCMEIYSCDIVDQPAANPTGLFQAMSENTATPEVPAENAPVEVAEAVEVTSEVSSAPVPKSPATEEVKEDLEVKGPEGTQNASEEAAKADEAEVVEVAEEPAKVETESEAEKAADAEDLADANVVIQTRLSAVVENFDSQKAEIINLRADLETAHRNLTNLRAEIEKRDLQIAQLEETKKIALRAVGLLPADVLPEVDPAPAAPFDPVAAYSAAVESGDKKLAAELFKAHKSAIFAARRK